jgi:hypothetical protein
MLALQVINWRWAIIEKPGRRIQVITTNEGVAGSNPANEFGNKLAVAQG